MWNVGNVKVEKEKKKHNHKKRGLKEKESYYTTGLPSIYEVLNDKDHEVRQEDTIVLISECSMKE